MRFALIFLLSLVSLSPLTTNLVAVLTLGLAAAACPARMRRRRFRRRSQPRVVGVRSALSRHLLPRLEMGRCRLVHRVAAASEEISMVLCGTPKLFLRDRRRATLPKCGMSNACSQGETLS